MLDNPLGRKVLWSIIPYLLILSLLNSFEYNDLPYFPQSESPHLLGTNNYESENENNDRYNQKGIILDKQVYESEYFAKIFSLLYNLNRDIGYKFCISESKREATGFIWNKTTHIVEVKYETDADASKKQQQTETKFAAQAAKDSAMLHCIASQLLVRIDDSLQVATEFDFYKHPKINRKGIMTTLDLKEIPRGKHYVSYSVKDSTDVVVRHYKVAFWKK